MVEIENSSKKIAPSEGKDGILYEFRGDIVQRVGLSNKYITIGKHSEYSYPNLGECTDVKEVHLTPLPNNTLLKVSQ